MISFLKRIPGREGVGVARVSEFCLRREGARVSEISFYGSKFKIKTKKKFFFLVRGGGGGGGGG